MAGVQGKKGRNPIGESMIIPVRCFSCGKVIGSAYEEYKKRTGAGEKPEMVLDSLGIKRYCCRRIIISHVDLIDEVAPYG